MKGFIMDKIKIISVFGTRPEAIKMAPLVKKMETNPNIISKVLVTGQHRQMLDSVLDIFNIKPDFDLNIMKHGQTIQDITYKVMYGVCDIIKNNFKPDLLLVHGDTSTSFSSALGAFYEKIPVGHVEAGLRTGNIYSPYPEEMNRKLIGSLSTYHFAPTINNKTNLLKENISEKNIIITGNTVIDALHSVIDVNYDFSKDENLKKVDFNKKIILLTCHRRENWGTPMENIFDAINKVASENKDIQIIYPVHMNPQIVKLANEKLTQENIILIEPLEYVEFANLINKSHLILTDSGGLQEEAPSLGKPVLVLRTETERPEAVDAGTVKVIGVEYENVYKEITNILNDKKEYDKMSNAVNPYGDGKACDRIIDFIENLR
ncbi:UDP-N-acetylglucosamine 2-epimerase [[Eubacterium] yurii subsp. margaretiae ATCC 43715]|nr:UDP-N-acetylglucosamine 2-epimerase [[Eubacterium] yurii subsp. margaretiae ATCC 43715]